MANIFAVCLLWGLLYVSVSGDPFPYGEPVDTDNKNGEFGGRPRQQIYGPTYGRSRFDPDGNNGGPVYGPDDPLRYDPGYGGGWSDRGNYDNDYFPYGPDPDGQPLNGPRYGGVYGYPDNDNYDNPPYGPGPDPDGQLQQDYAYSGAYAYADSGNVPYGPGPGGKFQQGPAYGGKYAYLDNGNVPYGPGPDGQLQQGSTYGGKYDNGYNNPPNGPGGKPKKHHRIGKKPLDSGPYPPGSNVPPGPHPPGSNVPPGPYPPGSNVPPGPYPPGSNVPPGTVPVVPPNTPSGGPGGLQNKGPGYGRKGKKRICSGRRFSKTFDEKLAYKEQTKQQQTYTFQNQQYGNQDLANQGNQLPSAAKPAAAPPVPTNTET